MDHLVQQHVFQVSAIQQRITIIHFRAKSSPTESTITTSIHPSTRASTSKTKSESLERRHTRVSSIPTDLDADHSRRMERV